MNNNQKPTTVGGVPTGDMTNSGNPTHNPDGTFGSNTNNNANFGNFDFSGSEKYSFLNNLDLDGADAFDFLNDIDLDSNDFDYNQKRTVDEVIENFEHYMDDDILSWLEQNDFYYSDKFYYDDNAFFDKRHTSHASQDKIILNAVADKRFKPINVIDKNQFMQMKKQLFSSISGNGQYPKKQDATYCERGFSSRSAQQRMAEYTGEQNVKLKLPYGMYGSAIYSAFDVNHENDYSSTARNYASGGFIMKFIIDNKSSNTLSYREAATLQNDMLNKFDSIEKSIIKNLENSKYNDDQKQKIVHAYKRTLQTDITFAPVLCGYDVMYDTSSEYAMVLNLRNCYTYKNW